MEWFKKYELLVKDNLISKDINQIMDWDYATTRKFRLELLATLKSKGITLENDNRIPTEIFLEAIGKNMSYYEKKMMQEHKLNKLRGELNETK